jgi:type I restriction enzyme, S subunit
MSSAQVPEGYKQTEIGVIPEDWETCTLGDAVDFLDIQRKPIRESERAKMRGIYPYYGASGIVDYVNNYLFDEELILLGEDGENILSRNSRLAFRVSGKIWVNNHAHVLRNKPSFDVNFLSEYLESIDYSLYNSGTAQPKLNQQVCRNIGVVQPPIEEQHTIAQALSDVDALIASLDKLIAKQRQLKTAAMQQLLTGKMRLQRFGTKWETYKIGELFEITAGGDLVKSEYSEIMDDNYPYPIYANSIFDYGLYGYSSFREYEGDCITVTARGTLGAAYYRPTPFVAIGRLIVLKPKNKLDSFFVSESINHRIEFASESTGVPQLTAPQIAKYELDIPPLEEQRAIATVLSDMDTAIAALEQRQAKTQAVKQGMMQELLTGRTRLV